MMAEIRSAAAQAGVCDEQRLLFDASAAFVKALSRDELDRVWRVYVSPVWDQIDSGTQKILLRLYSTRLSIL